MEHREIVSQPWEVNVSRSERIISAISGAGLLGVAMIKPSWWKSVLGLSGAYMLFRGVSGHCTMYRMLNINRSTNINGIRVERSVTINRPVNEIYAFWRNFENLPTFMEHLKSVTIQDGRRSHWVAKAPLGMQVEWDAEIISEQTDQWISWRSLPDAMVANTGIVRFKHAPAGRGTEVQVHLEYMPPAGTAGVAIAKLLGEEPDLQIQEDLRRLKRLLETGEIPTIEGQTSGHFDPIAQLV